jgi:hypothetical protein
LIRAAASFSVQILHNRCGGKSGSGRTPLVAMTISGHKTISVFKRYAIPMDDSQAEALKQVAEYHKTKVKEAEDRRKASNVLAMAANK